MEGGVGISQTDEGEAGSGEVGSDPLIGEPLEPQNRASIARHIAEGRSRPRPPWLVRGFLPAGQVIVLGAEPKTGKSWLAAELGVSIGAGVPFLGMEAAQRPVLYVAGEDDPDDLIDRTAALVRGREGLDPWRVEMAVMSGEKTRLDVPGGGRAVIREAQTIGAGLVILDPLVNLHRAEENDSAAMSSVMGAIRDIVRQTGAAVLVTHHLRKPGRNDAAGGGNSLRGSGVIRASPDGSYYLTARRGGLRLSGETRSFAKPETFLLTRTIENEDDIDKRVCRHERIKTAGPAREGAAKRGLVDYKARVYARLDLEPTRAELVRECGSKTAVLGAVRALLAEGRAKELGGRIVRAKAS